MRRLLTLNRPDWWTPIRADTALALGLYASQVLTWYVTPAWTGMHTTAATYLWGAVELVPVVLRRRWLWPATLASSLFALLALVDGVFWASQGVAVLVLAYTLAAYERWWRAVAGNLLLWLTVDLAFLYSYYSGVVPRPVGEPVMSASVAMLYNIVTMIVLFLIGRTVRARREATAAIAERAFAAEANQHAHAAQAVAEERRRIARELHDVVAHHVSVIGIMATGARRMLTRDPAAADEALGTIEQTSRTTLRELRRLLFVLRAETEPDAQLTPQPGLAGIRTLVDQVCEAGLPTVLRVEGEPADLDPGVALTVYRIVQEALTNAIKHAGPATAEVRLCCDPRQLTIEVFDTGRGLAVRAGDGASAAAAVPYGHGLLGMRERVAVHGGSLRTGSRPGGGFRVYAEIPITELEVER